MNLSTDNVKVFPIATRQSHTFTEPNITFMLRPFLSGKIGIVHYLEFVNNHLKIEFNLYGYAFSIAIPEADLPKTSTSLYAIIGLRNNQINGSDNDKGQYEGLLITEDENERPNIIGQDSIDWKVLKIAKGQGTEWEIPQESLLVTGLISAIDGKV